MRNLRLPQTAPLWPSFKPLPFSLVQTMLGNVHPFRRNGSDPYAADPINHPNPTEITTIPVEGVVLEVLEPQALPLKNRHQTQYVDHVARLQSMERYVLEVEQALNQAEAQSADKERRIQQLESELRRIHQAMGGEGDPPFASSSDSEQTVGVLEQLVSQAEQMLAANLAEKSEKERRIEALQSEIQGLQDHNRRQLDEFQQRLNELQQRQGEVQQLAEQREARIEELTQQLEGERGAHEFSRQQGQQQAQLLEERLQALEARMRELEAERDQAREESQQTLRQLDQVRGLQHRMEQLLRSHQPG